MAVPRRGAIRLVVAFSLVMFSCALRDFAEEAYEDQLVNIMLEAGSRKREVKIRPLHMAGVPLSDVVCYEHLGCYSREPYGLFPEDPDFLRPTFKLYTQESPDTPAMIYQYNCTFGLEDDTTEAALRDTSRSLVFIAHGFGGFDDLEWVKKLRTILTNGHYRANTIVIDWSRGARISTMYSGSAANSVLVGRMAAYLCLRIMDKFNIPVENVQFIGFSLGGQMSGFFAESVYNARHQRVGKITALDSAAPLFEPYGIYPRKQYTRFLEAVHTSAGNYLWKGKVGVAINYGHVDYYPNGGIDQPGCNYDVADDALGCPYQHTTQPEKVVPGNQMFKRVISSQTGCLNERQVFSVSCSHSRAVDYYIDALESRHDCIYSGYPCYTVEDANQGICSPVKDVRHFMSMDHANINASIYFLRTRSAAPYCMKN